MTFLPIAVVLFVFVRTFEIIITVRVTRFATYSDMTECTLPSSGIVLHVWPGQWALPSFDPQCLAALLYLQLAIPGQFRVAECSNPDLSPTGRSFASSFITLED